MKKDVIKIRRKKESKGNEIPIKVEGEDSVYVKPVYVRKGDIVVWEAIDSDVNLFFPVPHLFGETLGTIFKGQKKALKVLLSTRKKEEIFHYALYHHGIGDFGHGNSNPAIIIRK